ncbi:MAG: hypothetical protein Q7J28_04260 [Caulobacter sp.]|nr:hypothetical protein [Caulobacter sp.]
MDVRAKLTAALIGLVMFVLLAEPAAACTPAPPPKLSPAQKLAKAQAEADRAASPHLGRRLRDAVDIAVVSVADFKPSSVEDLPPRYRDSLHWYGREGLLPVRYTLKTERVLKGNPPAIFPFRFHFPNITSDREWAWAVAPNDDFGGSLWPRSDQAFWVEGSLSLGEFSGGPGDCSNQVALNPSVRYLVLRDSAGMVTVAEPLTDNDPLPDLIARFLASESETYVWRPTVQEYLGLAGSISRLRIADCATGKFQLIEALGSRPGTYFREVGEIDTIYGLTPSLSLTGCREGDEFLLTVWPARLHPVVDNVVHFEDRWMQLRFSGEKNIPLTTLRELLR